MERSAVSTSPSRYHTARLQQCRYTSERSRSSHSVIVKHTVQKSLSAIPAAAVVVMLRLENFLLHFVAIRSGQVSRFLQQQLRHGLQNSTCSTWTIKSDHFGGRQIRPIFA